MTAVARIVAAGSLGALIQRKGRKAHIAALRPGATHWVSICDREVPADARTGFWRATAAEHAEDHEDEICVYCWRQASLLGRYLAAAGRIEARLRAEVEQLRAELAQRDADDLARPFSLAEVAA